MDETTQLTSQLRLILYSLLPEPLQQHSEVLLHSNNHSGNLFMFAHKKIDQQQPMQNYQIQMRQILASNAPYGCGGIGGGGLDRGPGEHVFVKAGVSEYLPQAYINNWR